MLFIHTRASIDVSIVKNCAPSRLAGFRPRNFTLEILYRVNCLAGTVLTVDFLQSALWSSLLTTILVLFFLFGHIVLNCQLRSQGERKRDRYREPHER
jgi:hypothetical protein